jgi:hypothetical protein
MPLLNTIRRTIWPRVHRGEEETPPPFPTLSTFLGIAAVMFVIWLLASGLPHLLSSSDRSATPNNIEAGASK